MARHAFCREVCLNRGRAIDGHRGSGRPYPAVALAARQMAQSEGGLGRDERDPAGGTH